MPNYFDTNNFSIQIVDSHVVDANGTQTGFFTLPDEATGVFLQAINDDEFIRLDGSSSNIPDNGLRLFVSDGFVRFDLEPGKAIFYEGNSSSSELRWLFFKISDGIA